MKLIWRRRGDWVERVRMERDERAVPSPVFDIDTEALEAEVDYAFALRNRAELVHRTAMLYFLEHCGNNAKTNLELNNSQLTNW